MVGEESIIELGKNRHLMRILVNLAQVLAVLVKCPSFIPALGHSGVILPLIEQSQMLIIRIIQRPYGEELVQMRNVPAIDERASGRFGGTNGVHGMNTDIGKFGRQCLLDREQGISGLGLSNPDRLWSKRGACSLPERASEEDQLADMVSGIRHRLTWRSRRAWMLSRKTNCLQLSGQRLLAFT